MNGIVNESPGPPSCSHSSEVSDFILFFFVLSTETIRLIRDGGGMG